MKLLISVVMTSSVPDCSRSQPGHSAQSAPLARGGPPRVLVKDTISLDQLLPAIAKRAGQENELIGSVLKAAAEEILAELLRGNSVNLEGLVTFSPTLNGRVPTLTADLPPDSVMGVSARTAASLLDGFKAGASFVRVSSNPLAPEILEVSVLEGSVDAISSGQVLVVKGNRIGVDPTQMDEGIILLNTTDGSTLRAATYLDKGDKLLRALLPAGLVAGMSYSLSVTNRRTPGGPLYSTDWPQDLTAAGAAAHAARKKATGKH